MNDGSGGHDNAEGAIKVATRMKGDLIGAGFVPHAEKCRWNQSQSVSMLGMGIDLKVGRLTVTPQGLRSLRLL